MVLDTSISGQGYRQISIVLFHLNCSVSFDLVYLKLCFPTIGERLEVFQFLKVVEMGSLFPNRNSREVIGLLMGIVRGCWENKYLGPEATVKDLVSMSFA